VTRPMLLKHVASSIAERDLPLGWRNEACQTSLRMTLAQMGSWLPTLATKTKTSRRWGTQNVSSGPAMFVYINLGAGGLYLPPAPFAQERLFVVKSPANSPGICRVIVLALDDVLRAAIVEAKDLVVQVETVTVYLESPRQPVAGLGVELEMRVEVVIAGGTGGAADPRIGNCLLNAVHDNRIAVIIRRVGEVLVLIGVDHGEFVGHAHPH
jgi:hypothetical protein